MNEPTGATTSAAGVPMLHLPSLALGAVTSFAIAKLGDAAYCVLFMAGSCGFH